jgi:hypothetical protein
VIVHGNERLGVLDARGDHASFVHGATLAVDGGRTAA